MSRSYAKLAGVLSYASEFASWSRLHNDLTRNDKARLNRYQTSGVELPGPDATPNEVTGFGLAVCAEMYKKLREKMNSRVPRVLLGC